MKYGVLPAALIASLVSQTPYADASSHREAPFIAGLPRVDGTDFYLFRSYEPGRDQFVTVIANYIPLEDAYGGPNYFKFDENALYEIHLDLHGQAREDLTFQFQFKNTPRGTALSVGGQSIAVPLNNIGPVGASGSRTDTANLTVDETYSVNMVRGDRRKGRPQAVTNVQDGSATFIKPVDYQGTRSFPNYDAYARDHIYAIAIPGCNTPGRMFVGQRREGFSVNLGQFFDLLNTATLNADGTITPFIPAGQTNERAGQDTVGVKNISSLSLELPISCLVTSGNPVIGGWTTASLHKKNLPGPVPLDPDDYDADDWVQVSRLANPLVNELIIGLPDKDRFNSSEPKNDGQFLKYVTNPSFTAVVESLFGPNGTVVQIPAVQAPTLFPRADLVATFLTGLNIPGVITNQPTNVHPAELMRLDTSTPPQSITAQNKLGVIGGDVAGYPNGRRPGDDVTSITLRVAMGRLISLGLFGTPSQAPAGLIDFTDGSATTNAGLFDATFPYLTTPHAGNLVREPTQDNHL